MTATTLTVSIAGNTSYNTWEGSLTLPDIIEQRSQLTLTIHDANGAFVFQKGQIVTVTDTLENIVFYGKILDNKRTPGGGSDVFHNITCTDRMEILDEKTSNRLYINQYSGAIAVDQIKDEWVNGILANYAIDTDTTQADFAAGNLNGTIASANVDDGNLELAPAGTPLTVAENTTAIFGAGTLTNCQASNNSLVPSPTATLKMIGTESLVGDSNAYAYVKIYQASNFQVLSGRYLEYDIWIDPKSPEIKSGVDITFTDGTTLRDTVQAYPYYDIQNIPPHPNKDLSGYADGRWYHRKFLMNTFVNKFISHVDVVFEGDKGGTYTTYFKNIGWTDGTNFDNRFFGGSFSINPPQQLQNSGYGNISLSIVNTYDCYSPSQRVSPSYNANNVKLLKSSFLSWKAVTPTGTSVLVEYSLDSGNSYTTCINNAPLPNLPAGLSLANQSIQFRQTLQQSSLASPESQVQLTSMQVFLIPSYIASKSDVVYEAATNAQFNSGTLTNTQALNNILRLLGDVRSWAGANTTGMTVYGNGTGGGTGVVQYCNYKVFWLQMGITMEGRSRLDFLGQWQNFCLECDIVLDVNYGKNGIVYRTTGWSNYDGTFAYAVECLASTSIKLYKGTNNGGATGNGGITLIASATLPSTNNPWHHLKVVVNSSTHQIYLDDILFINATDSTYTAAGYVGFRTSNSSASQGYQGQFNNLGLTTTGLSGTWISPVQSLTAAGTYGGSVVSWQDASLGSQSTNLLVESTINGGSTWQAVTNGAAIANLTLGQSLSGINVQFRVTLSTASASSMPQLQYLVVRVLGGFSSSGTRINKALLLTPVGTCGSTLVAWNALTPPGTSVTFATSLDGTTYTNVNSGGSMAGINQQPAPTIDTFNLLSSGSYTNTARTGGTVASWTWDTANSRLTASGGTNALLIYSAVSCVNVDAIFDVDQADNCGIVWRYTDPSNYYELLIYDASSNAGSTNVLKLFKVVANVKTQIGSSTAITLTRGTIVKRVRVTMIGTAITIYFDGVSVLSATDGSLAGSGQVGLSSVSGIGRMYNLRIQPQGDNLSGKQVYVRQTLTSTDPTQTPQITDMTAIVTNPNIGAGALVPIADYRNTYKSDNIKDLAKRSNYYHNVKHDGSFIFLPRRSVPAPWVLSAASPPDILNDGLEVEDSADVYRNKHTLINVQSTIVTSEIHTGDGSATSFTLKYNVVSMTSIVLNGQSKTFGVKGTTGKDFYYQVGSNSLAQDSSGAILQNIVDQLTISYTGQTTTTVTRDNTGQFPGTVSQQAYIDQCGISIPVQTILNQAVAVVSTNGNSDDLDVSLVKRIAVDVNITAQAGTSPTVQFFLDRKAADGTYDPIWQSSVLSALRALSVTVGPRCAVPEALGTTVRIRWAIGGSASPSKTFSISIQGRVDAGLAGIGVVEAVEDVSSQNLNVAAAQALGDSRLTQYGVIGRTLRFKTNRTGLAVGQYLSVFLPSMKMIDASLLITKATRTQKFKMDAGSPSQSYFFDIEAIEGPNLGSWESALNQALQGGNI